MFEISVMLNVTSPLICRHILKQSDPVSRMISFSKHLKPQSVLLDKSKYKIIYEFPYIAPTAYLIRTKIWVPAIMTLITPPSLLFSEIRLTILGGLVASWIHGGIVHQMSKFAMNMIGKVYINQENESKDVIISALDKNGNRIDRCHDLKDLIICDYSTKLSHSMGFIKIHANDSNIMYQMNIINCKIYDQKICTALFGSRWVFNKEDKKTV